MGLPDAFGAGVDVLAGCDLCLLAVGACSWSESLGTSGISQNFAVLVDVPVSGLPAYGMELGCEDNYRGLDRSFFCRNSCSSTTSSVRLRSSCRCACGARPEFVAEKSLCWLAIPAFMWLDDVDVGVLHQERTLQAFSSSQQATSTLRINHRAVHLRCGLSEIAFRSPSAVFPKDVFYDLHVCNKF